MENMNVNAQVVNKVEVKEEKAMENQNVVAQEEVKTVRRFCTECGKPMEVPVGSRITTCDSCREAKKKAQAEKAHKLAMERKIRLNQTTINLTLNEQVKEVFKKNAKEKGLSLGDYLAELLNVKVEEVKQEENIA